MTKEELAGIIADAAYDDEVDAAVEEIWPKVQELLKIAYDRGRHDGRKFEAPF